MRNPFKICAVAGALLLPLSAQDGEGYGFLNIANLVPGDTPCEINIGGESLKPDGLKSGADTGWFMVRNGSKELKVSVGELESATGTIVITEAKGNLIGIYLEPDPRLDSEGRPNPPRIRIKSFPTYETTGFALKFVSLCPEQGRFQLGPLKIDAKPFVPIEIPKWNGGGFEIIHNGEKAGQVSGSSEGGAFYLLVGEDQKGGKAAVLVGANMQEVPEYLRKDKPKPVESGAAAEPPTTQP